MIDGKRVIVVLPAYNAGKTLERTIAEIPPGIVDECLVVDDASRDDTVSQRAGWASPASCTPRTGVMARTRKPVTSRRCAGVRTS